MHNELSYWAALSHLQKMRTTRKNELVIIFFNRNKTIVDFFTTEKEYWQSDYGLSDIEIQLLNSTIDELVNYTFMVEDLLTQGYELIPIISKEYSPIIKKNLKKSSPLLLYAKGNKQLLQENSIAIVGSRKASEISLTFTDNIAKKASSEFKVVVSGFAKGVDRQALDSALTYNGQSIIVLPQGITTFSSGFKQYYKQIVNGDVLVLSTFYPSARWSVELAMARNSIIYGLANEIYVAESDSKGGTWQGATNGIKKANNVFVRYNDSNEKNANNQLIDLGAKAIDINGNLLDIKTNNKKVLEYTQSTLFDLDLAQEP